MRRRWLRKTRPVYVLAPTYKTGKQYARDMGLDSRAVLLNEPRNVRGLHDCTVYVLFPREGFSYHPEVVRELEQGQNIDVEIVDEG